LPAPGGTGARSGNPGKARSAALPEGSDALMTVTIPLVLVIAIVTYACYRYMGLKLWHLIVCLLLGFLLAATSAAPEIQNFLNAILHGGHK
jgi:F0F1-type ATP synthase assembly protein I